MNAELPRRPTLPQVTLVAVTSVNVRATVKALEKSMEQVRFGAVRICTHQVPSHLPAGIEWVRTAPLQSSQAYSDFILHHLADNVHTSHCLLVQWDGHVINGDRWRPEFLSYDYVGARWPHFSDGHDVGNGGFSLRSLALLEACREPSFRPSHPEDVAIGRHNRIWLEARGIKFAPPALADAFSAERAGDSGQSFGYHGVWHMPRLLGRDAFWEIYNELDERTGVRRDFATLLWQLFLGKGGIRRAINFFCDQILKDVRRRNLCL